MKTTKFKRFAQTIASILIVAIVITSFTGLENVTVDKTWAATNGIVKGPDTPDVEDSFTTTLSTGETTTIKIVSSVLTIKVSSSEYIFKIGNITKTADAAVVNEKDGLLHILTLGGAYYVFDLYTGVQIVAYRNSSNGKYCSSRNSYAYMVYGKSLINNTYFYELLTSNSVSRELLMTRAEFDIIINGGDPSVDIATATPVVTKEPTQEPTQVPTQVPTVEPTQVPTQVPTVKPTQVPTQIPTVAPTQVPILVPTVTPVVEIDTKTEFNFEFWWKMYTEGTITWEQFTQVMSEHHWTLNTQSTETSTTYYFYDEDGKLIRTKTVTTSDKTETGTGSGTVTEETTGKAEVDVKVEGNGEVTGESKTETKIYVNVSTPTSVTANNNSVVSKTTKTKTTFHVKRKNNKVKLTRTIQGKTGVICSVYFKKKNGIARFDGITYKGIKYVGYTSLSRQIVMVKKNGDVIVIPRAKGVYGKTYTAKKLKGKWKCAIENTSGLTIRVSDGVSKVMGVKNAKPKRIK